MFRVLVGAPEAETEQSRFGVQRPGAVLRYDTQNVGRPVPKGFLRWEWHRGFCRDRGHWKPYLHPWSNYRFQRKKDKEVLLSIYIKQGADIPFCTGSPGFYCTGCPISVAGGPQKHNRESSNEYRLKASLFTRNSTRVPAWTRDTLLSAPGTPEEHCVIYFIYIQLWRMA